MPFLSGTQQGILPGWDSYNLVKAGKVAHMPCGMLGNLPYRGKIVLFLY